MKAAITQIITSGINLPTKKIAIIKGEMAHIFLKISSKNNDSQNAELKECKNSVDATQCPASGAPFFCLLMTVVASIYFEKA